MDSTASWRDEVVGLIPALRAFAWSLSHNGSDADDLVQDTLIKAWSNRDKFEVGTILRAWLFTILRNTYYTNVLRRRREVRDELGEYASTLHSPPTQDWSVAMRALQTALLQLPDEHREALILVGAAGLSYDGRRGRVRRHGSGDDDDRGIGLGAASTAEASSWSTTRRMCSGIGRVSSARNIPVNAAASAAASSS